MKIVSVITVVYNGVNEIEETILSVLNQQYTDIEYIIIDGGSTDGTIDIIKKYLDKIAVFVTERDGGVYDAMNKGVSLATAEWINFMNCGDSFYNNDVLKNVFNVGRIKGDVIYGSVCTFDRYKNVIIQSMPLQNLNKRMIFCHQSSFVKRELLLRYPFDKSFKICADYNLFYTLYKHGFSFEKINQCIANYEMENGLSSRNAFLSEKENMKINKTWNKPLNMTILMCRMTKFHSLSFLKKMLPYKVMKRLKDYKYSS